MKKNRYEVWKQTFSELDFEMLRVKSAALGNSLNTRHHRPAGRNKSYQLLEDDCKSENNDNNNQFLICLPLLSSAHYSRSL